MFRIETTQAQCYELQTLNCDGIDRLCTQGTIYYDDFTETMRYDVVVEDGTGTSIYAENFAMISNFASRIKNGLTMLIIIHVHMLQLIQM